MTASWTEEQIAAHIDGALDPEADAAIRRVLARDPEARAVAERLRALNRLLAAAYPVPEGAIPAGIARALAPERRNPGHGGALAGASPVSAGDRSIERVDDGLGRKSGTAGNDAARSSRPAETDTGTGGGRVVPLPARRRTATLLPLAAAASIALAVGIGAGALLSGPGESGPAGRMLADAGPALEQALATLPSGTLSAVGIRPLSTFRDAEGRPCREFETSGADPAQSGIACRLPGGAWDILALIALPGGAAAEPGFAPASGAEGTALDATLDAIGAEPPLAPAAEEALIRSGWQ